MMFLEYLVANSNGLLGEITEEVTTVGFEGFSASEILTNVMTSLTTAVTAGALIYFIVKAIKKQLDKINEQKQELVSVDAGSASEQLTNSASFEKEQAEGENQTVVLVDGVVTSETKTETTITQYEQTKKKANIPAIVMMAASIGWLVFEWVMELISGFVG